MRAAISGMPLPTVRLRAFTSADAPVVRPWASAPERFLRVADLLASAEVPGTVTLLAEDADGRAVALFQSAPEGSERAGMRSVALLVHPGRRRAGFGRAVLLAALDESRYGGSVLLAVIDRENAASLRCFAACGFAADDDAAPGNHVQLVCRVPASAATTQPRFSSGSPTVDRAGRRRDGLPHGQGRAPVVARHRDHAGGGPAIDSPPDAGTTRIARLRVGRRPATNGASRELASTTERPSRSASSRQT